MKNAYQRRRVKARVEKRARMTKIDTITLEFARQVIEEETGTPLEIQSAPVPNGSASAGDARLVARDEKKNPLISTFEWAEDATLRILRVPAGFMRNKTQERVEALARERALTAIDLGLVEEGIEIGKKIMAEVIAAYPTGAPDARTLRVGVENAGKGAAAAAAAPTHGPSHAHTIAEAQNKNIADAQDKAQVVPAVGSGYLNEVSSLTVPSKPGAAREH
jgi:hypothetical protein